MTWSQENCLINDRRLTCERWGRGFATSLLFLAFGDENIFAYAYEALFRSREGAFFSGQKVFSMVSAPWRSIAHTFHSVLCFAALRRVPKAAGFSGPLLFFGGRLRRKVFSMVSALWRSTAHTFHSVLFAALRQSPGRARVFSGPPPFFSEGRLSQKVFSMVSALWRSIAHTFISFADCGGAPWVRNPGGLLFFPTG